MPDQYLLTDGLAAADKFKYVAIGGGLLFHGHGEWRGWPKRNGFSPVLYVAKCAKNTYQRGVRET